MKTYTENREKNSPWLRGIIDEVTSGVDTFNGNIESMNSITPQDVMDFMKKLNSQENYRVVVLDPETK